MSFTMVKISVIKHAIVEARESVLRFAKSLWSLSPCRARDAIASSSSSPVGTSYCEVLDFVAGIGAEILLRSMSSSDQVSQLSRQLHPRHSPCLCCRHQYSAC